jgi:hypothetical protein
VNNPLRILLCISAVTISTTPNSLAKRRKKNNNLTIKPG